MTNGKSNFGFSYTLNMANFETFRWNISLSANFLFLKSDTTYKDGPTNKKVTGKRSIWNTELSKTLVVRGISLGFFAS